MVAYELSGAATVRRHVTVRTVLVLAGAILIQLALGSFFTFGNLAPYMISYLRNRTEETTIRNIDSIWVLSIGSMANPCGMVLAGIIDMHLGPRVATALGCLVFSGGIAVNYFTVKVSLVAVVVTYGFVSIFGTAMAYGITVQTAIKWLPHRPTLAAGLTVSGFGAGTLVFNNVITAFINPANLSPDLTTEDGERYFTDPDLLDRVPYCFLLLGGIYLVMQLIGLIVITDPPAQDVVISVGITNEGMSAASTEDMSAFHKHHENNQEKSVRFSTEKPAVIGKLGKTRKESTTSQKDEQWVTARPNLRKLLVEVYTSRSFYIIFSTVMSVVFSMLFLSSQYKAYGQTFIKDDHFLALVGTISSIFNCIGRPLWGMLMDRYGYRVTIRCLSVGLTVTAGTIIVTEHVHKAFFLLWICSAYTFFCGVWAVCPSALARLFGASYTSLNYGFTTVALGLANLLSGIFGVTLKDTIGWHGIFFMSCGMFSIPFFTSFLFNGVDKNGKRI